MTDYVTPQTATRLKQAGFKQPVPAPGQVWLMGDYIVFVCLVETVASHTVYYYVRIGEAYAGFTSIVTDFHTYLPTAPDILRELGQSAALLYDQDEFLPGYLNGFNGFMGFLQPHNENPAEACALAWEAKQKRSYEQP